MNRRILKFVIVLLAFIGNANAQTLSVVSIEATAGEQKALTVSLSDASSTTAMQFNLSLPANVTINESGCALGSAASNHTLRVSRMDNGNYLFVVDKESKVRKKYITTGAKDASFTQILGGLDENETIVNDLSAAEFEDLKIEPIHAL